MFKVVVASNNKHKIEEISAILKQHDYHAVSMSDAGLVDFDIEETGTTFEENALIKAMAAYEELGTVILSDDSGLEVDYLDGAPGVYSARYAGSACDDQKNNTKLLEALQGVPVEKRTARFVCVITMVFSKNDVITVRGTCEGYIGFDYKGSNGFGYDPLFIEHKSQKSFAQLENFEKNVISHRANALNLLQLELEKRK